MLFKNTDLSPEAKNLVDRKEELKELLKPSGSRSREMRIKYTQELSQVKKQLAKLKISPPQNGEVRKPETSSVSVSSKRF